MQLSFLVIYSLWSVNKLKRTSISLQSCEDFIENVSMLMNGQLFLEKINNYYPQQMSMDIL